MSLPFLEEHEAHEQHAASLSRYDVPSAAAALDNLRLAHKRPLHPLRSCPANPAANKVSLAPPLRPANREHQLRPDTSFLKST